MGPPYPAPPLRHFPFVQTAFGDLENDLRSGAGTEAPRALTAKTPAYRSPHLPMTDGDMMAGRRWFVESRARQLSTGGCGRKERTPFTSPQASCGRRGGPVTGLVQTPKPKPKTRDERPAKAKTQGGVRHPTQIGRRPPLKLPRRRVPRQRRRACQLQTGEGTEGKRRTSTNRQGGCHLPMTRFVTYQRQHRAGRRANRP